jgi:hypothetical protein
MQSWVFFHKPIIELIVKIPFEREGFLFAVLWDYDCSYTRLKNKKPLLA